MREIKFTSVDIVTMMHDSRMTAAPLIIQRADRKIDFLVPSLIARRTGCDVPAVHFVLGIRGFN